jgi:hypothetical protein
VVRVRQALSVVAIAGTVALPGAARAERRIATPPTAAGSDPTVEVVQPMLLGHAAVGYRNGHRHRIRVVKLGDSPIEIHTAEAFLAMQQAAAGVGIELYVLSGFRTRSEQAHLYRAWRRGWGNRAARPGRSNHESGRALDIHLVPGAFAWLRANAERFGFRRTVPGEPWHWEFVSAPVAVAARRHHGHGRHSTAYFGAARAGDAMRTVRGKSTQ